MKFAAMTAGVLIACVSWSSNILDYYCFSDIQVSDFNKMKMKVNDDKIFAANTLEDAVKKYAILSDMVDDDLLSLMMRDSVVRFNIDLFDGNETESKAFKHSKLGNIEVKTRQTLTGKDLALVPLFGSQSRYNKISLAQFKDEAANGAHEFYILKQKFWNANELEVRFLKERNMIIDSVECGYQHKCPVMPYYHGITMDKLNFGKLSEKQIESIKAEALKEIEDYTKSTKGSLNNFQTFPGANTVIGISFSDNSKVKFSVKLIDYDQDTLTTETTMENAIKSNVKRFNNWFDTYRKENINGVGCHKP